MIPPVKGCTMKFPVLDCVALKFVVDTCGFSSQFISFSAKLCSVVFTCTNFAGKSNALVAYMNLPQTGLH